MTNCHKGVLQNMIQLRFLAVLVDDKGNITNTLYDDNDLDCKQLEEIKISFTIGNVCEDAE